MRQCFSIETQLKIEKSVLREHDKEQLYMPPSFGQVRPTKWAIRLFFYTRILAVVCGPVLYIFLPPIDPNSGADFGWFAVIYIGLSNSHTRV